MHKEILNKDQLELLLLIKKYKREFYLVGGTAIALHIGHRRSVDFDFFKLNALNRKSILQKVYESKKPHKITRSVSEQLNITIQNVKFTFFQFPYPIEVSCEFEGYVKMPDLITLSAMKAFALGRRSKWKDYVDLFFIIRDFYTVKEISEKADYIFKDLFSEKQFRTQLSYFDDIDYSEEVEYLVPIPSHDEIKSFLIEKAIDIF